MRKRLALIWVIGILGLTMMLPAGTLAATTGYTYSIVDQHCLAGGHNVYFRVSLTAAGSTTANKLTIKSKSQYLSGGTWHNFYKWPIDIQRYTANGEAHTTDYSYTHQDNSDSRQWRIVSVLKAYNGTKVLSHKALKSKPC